MQTPYERSTWGLRRFAVIGARGATRALPAAGAVAVAALAAACGPSAPAEGPELPEPGPDTRGDDVRELEPEAAAPPAVLIVAIDGLRPDDARRADTPNLDRLAAEGVYTPEAEAAMPTITRTNFVTFATGGYADEHGVIGGTYLDDAWEERETDGPTLDEAQAAVPLPTIFEAAEEAGMRAGMLAMKGYELVGARGASVQAGGEEFFPDEIWETRYEPDVDGDVELAVDYRLRKNEILVSELEARLEEEPLDLILVNLGATDYVAHQQGPESDHYIRAIEASDAMIPRLEEIVRESAPARDWHVIVGTDHGFSQTDRDRLVIPHLEGVFEVEELRDAEIEHRIYERGGRAAELYLREPTDLPEAAEILSELPWALRIYADEDIPERAGDFSDLRVGYEGRRGSIYVITNPDHAFAYPNDGQHGSNDPEDLMVPIWISGPRVDPREVDLTGAGNVDIGPTALSLLGIDAEEALEGAGESLVGAPVEAR